MKKNPKVSVIIPTYKRPVFLKRAIESVLNQTYKNIELIVVDDNNDGDQYRVETETLMSQISDSRINYLKHSKNKNGAAARNTGLRESSGLYIAFLDDDDEFFPEKISNQVRKMEELDLSWGACYTSYKKINKNNKIQYGNEKREGYLLLEALMRSLYIGSGSNLFFRKSVINNVGFFDESFTRNQDLEYLVRVLEKYKMAYVDTCSLLIHYEIREEKKTYEQMKQVDKYYLTKFQDKIESLDSKGQKKVHIMFALESFRYAILTGNTSEGLNRILSSKISPYILIKYVFYIINRKITKRSYGFKF